jgi:hypothetical protein
MEIEAGSDFAMGTLEQVYIHTRETVPDDTAIVVYDDLSEAYQMIFHMNDELFEQALCGSHPKIGVFSLTACILCPSDLLNVSVLNFFLQTDNPVKTLFPVVVAPVEEAYVSVFTLLNQDNTILHFVSPKYGHSTAVNRMLGRSQIFSMLDTNRQKTISADRVDMAQRTIQMISFADIYNAAQSSGELKQDGVAILDCSHTPVLEYIH